MCKYSRQTPKHIKTDTSSRVHRQAGGQTNRWTDSDAQRQADADRDRDIEPDLGRRMQAKTRRMCQRDWSTKRQFHEDRETRDKNQDKRRMDRLKENQERTPAARLAASLAVPCQDFACQLCPVYASCCASHAVPAVPRQPCLAFP